MNVNERSVSRMESVKNICDKKKQFSYFIHKLYCDDSSVEMSEWV